MKLALIALILLASCTQQNVRYPRRWWLYDHSEWTRAWEGGRCDERSRCCLMPIVAPPVSSIRYYVRCCPVDLDVQCFR